MSTYNGDINVLALVKGDERYIVLYDSATRAEALRTLGRWAGDVTLSFNWFDAAVMSNTVKAEQEKEDRKPVNRICQGR